jgi:CHAD domain-containing protein
LAASPRPGNPTARSAGGRAPAERLRTRLVRRSAVVAQMADGLARGTPTPDDLHEWHRELRRLRVDTGLWLNVVPRARADEQVSTDRILRRLAKSIGVVRDADVGLALAERHQSQTNSEREVASWAELDRRLRQVARSGRHELATLARAPEVADLKSAVDRPLHVALPLAASTRLRRRADDALAVCLARLERSLARVYRRPTTRRLHQLRIELRNLRALDQTRAAIFRLPPLPVSPALRSFQVELGRLNDWDSLRAIAPRLLRGRPRKRVQRALSTRLRTSRRRLKRALNRKEPRRSFQRLFAD